MKRPITFLGAVSLARKLDQELQIPEVPQSVQYFPSFRFDDDGKMVPDDPETIDCSFVAPVPALAKFVQKQIGGSVKFFTTDVSRRISGVSFRRNATSVEIITPSSANFCQTRFARVKELIHQLDESYLSTDMSAKILMQSIEAASHGYSFAYKVEAILKDISDLVKDNVNVLSEPLHIEDFCGICATEIFLPWGKNGEKRKKLIELLARKVPELVIARVYRVPLQLVQYLAHSNYLGCSYQINSLFDIDISEESDRVQGDETVK